MPPPLTLSQLSSSLWEAANILRGPVDAADFKSYVFPLLFFKRLSDALLLEAIHHVEETRGDVRRLWGRLYSQNKTARRQRRFSLAQRAQRVRQRGKPLKQKNLTTSAIARLVTLEEIAANDHNLNIPRYVKPKVTSEVLTVEEAMKRLSESEEAAFAEEEKLILLLTKSGLLASK